MKTRRHTPASYAVAGLALIGMASAASAHTMTYIHEGFGSGQLGVGFPLSRFVITAQIETDDRVPREWDGDVGWSVDHLSASLWIDRLGDCVIETSTRTFVNNSLGMVGFSRGLDAGEADLYNGPTNNVFASWDMTTPIGPIPGQGELLQWALPGFPAIDTDRGTLIFNDGITPDGVFTALIPEPGTLSLLAAVSWLAFRRR